MKNPMIKAGIEVMNAIAALRLRPTARLNVTADGVEISQPGKPTLLLTLQAARAFSHQLDEAE